MEKNEVQSVKIYFINPIDILSVIIDTLIKIEYEAYSINDLDKEKILKILPENIRNVVFICIRARSEIIYWLEYIKKIKYIIKAHTLIGAFVYDDMDLINRNKFLSENVAVINFNEIKKNTLQIMKKILLFFEAKGKRPFIKTKAYGKPEIYFYFDKLIEPIVGRILNISSYAFVCEMDPMNIKYFNINMYLEENILILNGKRIKTILEVLGFSKERNYVLMFRYCSKNYDGTYSVKATSHTKSKIHEYIRWCIKENLNERLKSIKE